MNHLTSTIKHTQMDSGCGSAGVYLGGGAETIENMSNDARMCFGLCMHVSPLGRAPTRVATGYEYVCRYAFAYVYAGAGAGRLFLKCVCVRTVSREVGVKLVPTLL